MKIYADESHRGDVAAGSEAHRVDANGEPMHLFDPSGLCRYPDCSARYEQVPGLPREYAYAGGGY